MNFRLESRSKAKAGRPAALCSRLRALSWFLATLSLTVPTSAQVQVIPLRSGNGPVGGTDANVRVTLAGSSPKQRAVSSPPHAVVGDATTVSGVSLHTDPPARPIGIPPGVTNGGETVRFTSEFTVNLGSIESASLELVARADLDSQANSVVEVLLNDRWVADAPLSLPSQPDEWFGVDQIAPFLKAGVNQISIGVPGAGEDSHLAFSVRIRIRRPVVHTSPKPSVAAVSTLGPSTDLGVASAAGTCVGFTCRVRGDLDSVDAVALPDHLLFTECLSGVGAPTADDCEYADFDCDGHVDLNDTAFFQNAFGTSP